MAAELAELYGKLYLDQDVPVQLAGMLRARGIDILTTLEAGRLGQEDSEQLETAVADGRALLTHNRLDFEALHAEWLNQERLHFGILIAEQRRDLHETRDRILRLLNQFDHEQLRGGLFYV